MFPKQVTIEFNDKNLYRFKGKYADGTIHDKLDAPIFAVYEGKRQPVFCYEPNVLTVNPVTPGFSKNPLPDSIGKNNRAKYISVLWKYVGKY